MEKILIDDGLSFTDFERKVNSYLDIGWKVKEIHTEPSSRKDYAEYLIVVVLEK